MCTVFERVLLNHLYPKIERQFDNRQFGFRDKRSGVLQLLLYLHKVNENCLIAESDQLFVLYFDFKKPFDKVAQKKLIDKLQAFGIKRKLLQLIGSYHSESKQCVELKSIKSAFKKVTSGVPHGSILGPVMFHVDINDLPQGMQNFPLMATWTISKF